MNSLRAPYSRRGLRLFLGAQASLPAHFVRSVFWLIVTALLLTTSPTLFAQTNDNAATAGGRIAELARTPGLPPGNATVTLGLGFDDHSIFRAARQLIAWSVPRAVASAAPAINLTSAVPARYRSRY